MSPPSVSTAVDEVGGIVSLSRELTSDQLVFVKYNYIHFRGYQKGTGKYLPDWSGEIREVESFVAARFADILRDSLYPAQDLVAAAIRREREPTLHVTRLRANIDIFQIVAYL